MWRGNKKGAFPINVSCELSEVRWAVGGLKQFYFPAGWTVSFSEVSEPENGWSGHSEPNDILYSAATNVILYSDGTKRHSVQRLNPTSFCTALQPNVILYSDGTQRHSVQRWNSVSFCTALEHNVILYSAWTQRHSVQRWNRTIYSSVSSKLNRSPKSLELALIIIIIIIGNLYSAFSD